MIAERRKRVGPREQESGPPVRSTAAGDRTIRIRPAGLPPVRPRSPTVPRTGGPPDAGSRHAGAAGQRPRRWPATIPPGTEPRPDRAHAGRPVAPRQGGKSSRSMTHPCILSRGSTRPSSPRRASGRDDPGERTGSMSSRKQRDGSAAAPVRPHRRDFARMALTGSLGAAALLGPAGKDLVAAQSDRTGSGIKLCASPPPGRRTSNCSSSSRSVPST